MPLFALRAPGSGLSRIMFRSCIDFAFLRPLMEMPMLRAACA
jgi:hypothetical protein